MAVIVSRELRVPMTLEALPPAMASNTDPAGYAVSASSSLAEAQSPWRAFDEVIASDDNGSYWHSAVGIPQWIMIKFPKERIVRRFSIKNKNEGSWSHPGITEFKLQGSNNGVDFTDLGDYSRTSELAEVTEHEVTTPGSYQYYRIYITGSGYYWQSNPYCVIDEIKFYARF